MIYLSLWGFGAGPVTPHPLAAVAEPSLPGQTLGDLQGPSRTLQESGPQKLGSGQSKESQHHHVWEEWVL